MVKHLVQLIILATSLILSSCVSLDGQSETETECVSAIVAVSENKADVEKDLLRLKVVQNPPGVIGYEEISADLSLFEDILFTKGDYFYMSGFCGGRANSNTLIFPVYDIAPDRFETVLEYLNQNKIRVHVDSKNSKMMWVPKACQPMTPSCQIEIDKVGLFFSL